MAAAYYSRHWKTFPASNVSLPPAWDARLAFFPLHRMAVATAKIPPVAALIFMLCFASFATVCRWAAVRRQPLSSWQSIRRWLRLRSCPRGDAGADPDGVLLGLVLLSQRLSKAIAPGTTLCKAGATRTIVCIAAFATRCYCAGAAAVAATVAGGDRRWANRQLPEVLAQPVLWQALWTSCVLRWRQVYCA